MDHQQLLTVALDVLPSNTYATPMIDTVVISLRVLNVILLLAVFAFLAFGCAPARSAVDVETCRLNADRVLRIQAVAVCPGQEDFETCPEYDDLMAQYHTNLKACR